MEQKFNVSKKYVGFPSKNKIDAENLSFDDAKMWLEATENNYKKYGGQILEKTDSYLRVADDTDANEIIFEIVEQ